MRLEIDITDDQIDLLFLRDTESLRRTERGVDAPAFREEDLAQQLALITIVIDYKNVFQLLTPSSSSGSSTIAGTSLGIAAKVRRKRVPFPSSLSTSTLPPCSETI